MVWMAVATALALLFLAKGRSARSVDGIARLRRLQGEQGAADGAMNAAEGKSIRRISRAFIEFPYRASPARMRPWLTRDLSGLTIRQGHSLASLAGTRVWATLGFPLGLILLLRFSPVGIALAAPLGALGFMMPRVLAARGRNRYSEAARQALPHAADMLYAFVLGGKNLDQAFRGAAEASPEPLGSVLTQATREMELGASREEAFARMLERCPLPELASLLRSLTEAERRGHALSATLEVFSREIRLRRRDQLRVAVAKAPLKMLAPLVFLVLPASVLLTVGPTFLVTLKRVF
jgi:tight adherence protein C